MFNYNYCLQGLLCNNEYKFIFFISFDNDVNDDDDDVVTTRFMFITKRIATINMFSIKEFNRLTLIKSFSK